MFQLSIIFKKKKKKKHPTQPAVQTVISRLSFKIWKSRHLGILDCLLSNDDEIQLVYYQYIKTV